MGRITFNAIVNDEHRIFVMNADGSDLNILEIQPEICPEGLCWNLDPTWSPDGSKIAFFLLTPDVEGFGTPIYIVNANGTNATPLGYMPDTTGEYETISDVHGLNPDWSPDGSRIAAYHSSGLRVINTDSTGFSTINPFGRHPTWSPDGSKIAFIGKGKRSTSGTSGLHRDVGDIWVANTDGTGLTRLTYHRETPGSGGNETPSWSPDGSRIAFSHTNHDVISTSPANIWVMNPDGTGQKRVTDYSEKGEVALSPTWSPGGTKIAFDGPDGIYVVNVDGSGLKLLFREGIEGEGAISPDWN